ncbi:MAG: SMI1/KNR4 family protein [Gemmataceae bacterium]
MTNQIALLTAIREAPHDPSRRLIYADWLDEHHKPDEATLVRLHVEMVDAAETSPALEKFFPGELAVRERCDDSWLDEYENCVDQGIVAVSVARSWLRIRRRLNETLPVLVRELNEGASHEEVEELEASIGEPLPKDLKAYFRIHNGALGSPGLFFGLELLPTHEVQRNYGNWVSGVDEYPELDDWHASFPEGAVQQRFLCPGWIPLTYDGGGNHIGVDMAPGPKGRRGQVILFGSDDEQHSVVAWSWAEFLQLFAKLLEEADFSMVVVEEGEYTHIEGYDVSLFNPPDCAFQHPHQTLGLMAKRGILYDIKP